MQINTIDLIGIHFIRPEWLLATIPLFLLLWVFYRRAHGDNSWQAVIDKHLLKHLIPQAKQQQKQSKFWLLALSSLLIIALSGPSFHRQSSPVYELDKLQVILLDASPSTYTNDIKPSRFERSLLLIKQLLKQHKEGEVMLIAFSGEPYVISPPTSDAKPILNLLKGLTQQALPTIGSRLDLALKYTQTLLDKYHNKQVDILLLTDAHKINTKSLALAKAFKAKDYRLSVITVATDKAVPIQADNGFLKDNSGNVVVVKTNQRLLALLSKYGGGLYQLLKNDVKDIERYLSFTKQYIATKTTKQKDKSANRWVDSGIYIVFLLLPLMLILFRRGYLLIVLLGVGMFTNSQPSYAQIAEVDNLSLLKTIWQTQDEQANDLYRQGQYKQASEQFKNQRWRANALYKAGDYQEASEAFSQLRQDYNYANALAKSKQYQEAIDIYQKIKKTDKDYDDAQHNMKLVKRILQKQEQQEQKQQKDSKQKDKQKQDQNKDQDKQNQNKQKQNQNNQSDKDKQNKDKQKDEQINKQTEEDKQKDKKEKANKQEKSQEELAKEAEEKERNKTKKANQKQQIRKQKLEQIFKKIQTKPVDLLKQKFLIERYNRKQNKSEFINNDKNLKNTW